jgi:hypothetical protein
MKSGDLVKLKPSRFLCGRRLYDESELGFVISTAWSFDDCDEVANVMLWDGNEFFLIDHLELVDEAR